MEDKFSERIAGSEPIDIIHKETPGFVLPILTYTHPMSKQNREALEPIFKVDKFTNQPKCCHSIYYISVLMSTLSVMKCFMSEAWC